MLKKILILSLLLTLGGCVVKKEPFAIPKAAEVATPKPISRPIQKAFGGEEELTFVVKYLFIPVGRASMEVREMFYQGQEVYGLLIKFKANRLFSFFCPAEGEVKSYLDAQKLYTHRFEEHSVMGRHIYDRVTTYDQVKRLARFTLPDYDESGRLTAIEIKRVRIPPKSQEMLSAFYYVRTQELEEGKTLSMNVNERRWNYQVNLKVLNKEKVKVPAGNFLAWRMEPTVFYEGRMKKERSRGVAWLSADERKIPIKMKAKTRAGSFTLYLEGVKLP